MKRAALIFYDDKLSEYQIADLLSNDNTAEIDLKLVFWLLETQPLATRDRWCDALKEVMDILLRGKQ